MCSFSLIGKPSKTNQANAGSIPAMHNYETVGKGLPGKCPEPRKRVARAASKAAARAVA